MSKLYVDMDGVLTDWEGEVYRLAKKIWGYTGEYKDLTRDQKLSLVRSTPKFYEKLPWLPDGLKLWTFLNANYRPEILSAMSEQVPESLSEKYTWCTSELAITKNRINVVTRKSHKKMWACVDRSPNILIDDCPYNCNEWENAGGISVQWKNFEDSFPVLASALLARSVYEQNLVR